MRDLPFFDANCDIGAVEYHPAPATYVHVQ